MLTINPLDTSLLVITAPPSGPPGAVGHIGDILIGHIVISGIFSRGLHNYADRIHKVIPHYYYYHNAVAR